MAGKGVCHRDAFWFRERVNGLAAKGKLLGARSPRSERDQIGAVLHQPFIARADAIPFQHSEFRMVQGAAFPIAVDMGEAGDFRLAGSQ